MRIFFTLFLLLVILSDCKKDDNSTPQHGTYHMAATNGSSIRVFAKSGEIKDPAIVDRFTQIDNAEISRVSDHMRTFDTIQIIDGNNARLLEFGKYKDFTYVPISKDFNFYNSDTVSGYSSGEVYSRTLSYEICLYKPIVFSEIVVSSTQGAYQFQYKRRKDYYIEKSNNQLVTPWIVFTYHYAGKHDTYSIQNRLDNNFYKSLQSQDTVVMREYSLSCE